MVAAPLAERQNSRSDVDDEGYAVVWTPGYKRTWCQ
jgi:hypothetical protein